MKNGNNPILAGILVFGAIMTSLRGDEPVMRDAATHEQLCLALRKAEQQDPMKNMPAAKGADPSVLNRPKDLLSESDIISFRGLATLVPKRAILQIPEGCSDRIKMDPGSKIVSWADFYAANRGWINTVEVSRVQAEGNKEINEEVRDNISKSRNLVVATYMGGPISVLPLKVPEKADKQTVPNNTQPRP